MAQRLGFPELAGAFETILELRTSRLYRSRPYGKAFSGVVLVMDVIAVGLKVLDLSLDQMADHPSQGTDLLRKTLEGGENFGLPTVAQLVEQRFDPGLGCFGLGMDIVRYVPQMLGSVKKVQLTQSSDEAIGNDVPDPKRAVANQKDVLGLSHAPAQSLGMDEAAELLGWSIRSTGHSELFQNLAARFSGGIRLGRRFFHQLVQPVDDRQFHILPLDPRARCGRWFESPIRTAAPSAAPAKLCRMVNPVPLVLTANTVPRPALPSVEAVPYKASPNKMP